MSIFKDYLNESIKEYNYRVKTISILDNEAMDKMESILRKYDLKDVSSARKTPLQEHPLEFYNERNKEVYIVDVTLGMPISAHVLRSELQEVLGVYEGSIVVRAENDPIELQTQDINNDDEYKVKLSTESEYNADEQIEEDPSYGDDHNQKFLSRIARARIQMRSDVAAEKAAFNKGHDGVTPHYGNAGDNSVKGDMARTGNYDDERNTKNGVR